jgi:CBS domain-containing protein
MRRAARPLYGACLNRARAYVACGRGPLRCVQGAPVKVSDVMQRRVRSISEEETLGRALQIMLQNDIRHLPVLRSDGSRLTGVLSERDVLRAHRDRPGEEALLQSQIREFMSSPAEHIHPNADLADAAADLCTKKLGCLPVLDAGQLVGIVAVEDVLAVVAQLPVPQPGDPIEEPVSAVMTRDPLTVHPDDRVISAAAIMQQRGVRHLCVVDGDLRPLGIISDRDVRRSIGDPRATPVDEDLPERLTELRVASAMTPDPRTLPDDAPLGAAIDALLAERFGALPIVDEEDRLCGIVSYLDLLRRLTERVQESGFEPPSLSR